MTSESFTPMPPATGKKDADYVFYELTRSICPQCRQVIDAHILLRDNRVYMRKRCPEHGRFEALIYGDAQAYTGQVRFNKPGTIPLKFTTEVDRGCPHDCGLCPDHQQHACLGIIEVNSACNMDCPLCFADAGAGFNLTLAEVEDILDHFVETEGFPEVVQFSGGEPTIHPHIILMLQAAKGRRIRHVMLNTTCCAAVYESDWARLLLGDSFHPGGLSLTHRLGQLLQLGGDQRVLDVAAGQGASALFLARYFGCRMVGLEYGRQAPAAAQEAAVHASLAHRALFAQGDAEALPFARHSFDAILCECAFCTFPNKRLAAEWVRVLRPGGRLALSDLTRTGPLPIELESLLGWVACLADARPVDEYVAYLETADLVVEQVEPHDEALTAIVRQVQNRLLGAELWMSDLTPSLLE